MWDIKEGKPIREYLFWTFLLACISYSFVIWGSNLKDITIGVRIIVVLVDNLVGTFSPVYGVYIVLKRHKKISNIKEFIDKILHVPNLIKSINVTMLFCLPLLLIAMCIGTRTTSPWYMFIFAIPLMVIAGGVEEIGWRSFLQPELEKRYPFVMATLITAITWTIWHLPLWLIHSSSQASFAVGPYMLNLIADSFILATIFKLTKSVIPCMIYHAWGNAIGAIYQWKIFASAPMNKILLLYYIIIIFITIKVNLNIDYFQTKMLKWKK